MRRKVVVAVLGSTTLALSSAVASAHVVASLPATAAPTPGSEKTPGDEPPTQLSGAITRVAFPPVREGGVPASAVRRAAHALRRDGCVVLCSVGGAASAASPSADGHLLDEGGGGASRAGLLAEQALGLPSAAMANKTLNALLARVGRTGRDTRAEFEFAEIYHRSHLRYDVSCSADSSDCVAPITRTTQPSPPLQKTSSTTNKSTHPPPFAPPALSAALDTLVLPIICAAYLAGSGGTSSRREEHTSASNPYCGAVQTMCDGVVTSLPGAPAQQFHTDGPHGLVTAFVPLVDCHETGTELWLGSQDVATAELLAASGALDCRNSSGAGLLARGLSSLFGPPASVFARPELRRGDVLVFDYAVVHRGRAHPDAAGSCERSIFYRTFNWGGDASGVHEGRGGLNWPEATLVDAEAAAAAVAPAA